MGMMKEILINEYDESLEKFRQLETIVADLLAKTLEEGGIRPMQIAHRIKSRDSAMEKLERKPEKYSSINSLTDLIGFRIICYFNEQVDQMAELVSKVLDVDMSRSSDKRKLMAPTAFGYLSLHYICTLPKDKGYPEELTEIPFEIQFRTVLQHAWAEIEHDLGYKTEFGIPLEVRREFSRVAGLLEIADESFSLIKWEINTYVEMVRTAIKEDNAYDYRLDLVTLTEFMNRSKLMNALVSEITSFSGSEIVKVSPESYLERLLYLHLETLGDLTRFIEEEHDHALLLARGTLSGTDLDTLASTVGFYYICRARLVFGGLREQELREYFSLGENKNEASRKMIEKQVASILHLREKYSMID